MVSKNLHRATKYGTGFVREHFQKIYWVPGSMIIHDISQISR